MGKIEKPHTFGNKTDADPSKVNEDFDVLYDEFNGNIDEDNLIDWTVDQSQTTNKNTGSLQQLLDWITGRINSTIGKSNWYDDPDTDLKDTKSHIDASNPHSDSASKQDFLAHTDDEEIHQLIVIDKEEPEGDFVDAKIKIDETTGKIWVKPNES